MAKIWALVHEYWESGALLLPMFDAEWCVLRQFNKAAGLTGFRAARHTAVAALQAA